MKTPEIGLSLYQPIRETCFSGYIEVQEKVERLIVGVEVTEQFEGDATLEIVLLSDCDDCMIGGSVLHRTRPLTEKELRGGASFGFAICGPGEPYLCIQYVISGGTFTKGKVSARVSDAVNPWFVSSSDLVEIFGIPWDDPKPERKLP